jgi:hypothetical protein
VHFVILVNLALVLISAAHPSQASKLHKNKLAKGYNTQVWEVVFFSFYVVEVVAKLLHYGKRTYFQATWNRFDFGIVSISVLGFLIEIVGSLALRKGAAVDVHVIAVIFRCIRLLRVLRISESFRHVSVTMLFVVRKMVRYISVLLLAMYVFAIIGMGWFEGTVSVRFAIVGLVQPAVLRVCLCTVQSLRGFCITVPPDMHVQRDCSLKHMNATVRCGESYNPQGMHLPVLQAQ